MYPSLHAPVGPSHQPGRAPRGPALYNASIVGRVALGQHQPSRGAAFALPHPKALRTPPVGAVGPGVRMDNNRPHGHPLSGYLPRSERFDADFRETSRLRSTRKFGLLYAACSFSGRTTNTGQWACLTTESETLPISARRTPPSPLLPITIRSAPSSSAKATISRSTAPILRCVPATVPPAAFTRQDSSRSSSLESSS